ncbi:MAG: TRAP transporter large permease subunit [Pseudomonadota bacterium]|nr:TRAP transporter large permease subunit [Pseudomonadota bacterium]
MTDPQVAVFMLGIFIVTILLGFPICFTLVAMGVMFGYYAYFDAARMGLLKADGLGQTIEALLNNQIFDLLVNQTYSVMANDVLTAVPLFLFMGYIVERANIVDRLFQTLYVATSRLPGSMAIAALATCAMFATATGIIGAVVTLMGLLAFPAMLKAKYDISFSAGVICAGGCLGILIPPSIMLIVYSATTNVSVVELYAGALIPGFMLAGLYMVYVFGRAVLNPHLAPKPRPEDLPNLSRGELAVLMMTSFFPLAFLIFAVLGAILLGLATPSEAASMGALGGIFLAVSYRLDAIRRGAVAPNWSGSVSGPLDGILYSIGFGGIVAILALIVYVAVWKLFQMFTGTKLPDEPGTVIQPGLLLGIAAVVALLVQFTGGRPPLLGWLTPKLPALKKVYVFAGRGGLIGLAGGVIYMLMFGVLGLNETFSRHVISPYGFDVGFATGLVGYMMWKVNDQERLRESIYLTVRTSAMVCWLFVGSWTFSSVFSYLGGEQLIKEFVLSLDLSPVMFLILAQFIIFLLGWPLEWSEIIIIFIPIFLPMLGHFNVDPLFFGILVALNLQTSFLTPPMAMACYYLKGVAPPHVQLMDIFRGVMPFLSMIFLCMIILYVFPEVALWLPRVVYGN